jgi:hypothetical protein
MPAELAKWVTDIGAEMRLRAQLAALDARARHIDELLKVIAERETALNKSKVKDAPR